MSDFIQSNIEDHIGVAILNRPDVLNALNRQLMTELIEALEAFDVDPQVHIMVLAGSERAFAAGADISEMADKSVVDMIEANSFGRWNRIRDLRKPIIAAVSGYALGGGCELAMNCDIIVASESAQFGQPEINLGVIPGAGGTQRLTRAIGKSKAMDVILSGRFLTAEEACSAGLVARVVSKEQYLAEAMRLAREIAKKPLVALMAAKDAVRHADELPLGQGLEYERRLFYELFATEDQKEGMKAFMEKRKPAFKGR